MKTVYVFATALLCAVVGSASSSEARVWKDLPKRLPVDTVQLPVGGLRQVGKRCGPNALTMLLRSAGDSITEQEVADTIFDPRHEAALTVDLVLYARDRGFPAAFEKGSIDGLLSHLDRGQPCLLLLDLAPMAHRSGHLWHYLVVYGASRSSQWVLAQSGIGSKRIEFGELEKGWAPAGFWLMYLDRPSEGQ